MDQLRKCTKCGRDLPLECFGKDSQKKDGVRSWCKDCIKQRNQKYYAENSEKVLSQTKEYRNKNRESCLQRQKKYYQNNKEKTLEYQKKYAKDHPNQVRKYKKKYAEENKEKVKESRKQYIKHKKENDPCFKVILQLRYLIYSSLILRNDYKKASHTYEILGCSYEEAWEHLKQTWLENYGTEWNGEPYHIDHIIPLVTAKTEEEVINLCSINNLQMLTPQDNLSKNDKLNWQTDYKKKSMVGE